MDPYIQSLLYVGAWTPQVTAWLSLYFCHSHVVMAMLILSFTGDMKQQMATEHAHSVHSNQVAMEVAQQEKHTLQSQLESLSEENSELKRYTCIVLLLCMHVYTCVYM